MSLVAIPDDSRPIPPLSVARDKCSPQLDTLMACVRSYFGRYGRPVDGAGVLVALSGGPDSVALLSILLRLAKEFRWVIGAAHVNYGLRGEESDEDEAFCRELSLRWGVAFHCHHVEDGQRSADVNLQLWARAIRYAFFEEVASAHGYDKIATGHHLGDRAETVAAAVLDASGSFALSGIPPFRGRIIRPLFECRPQMIRDYLYAHQIPFQVDRSNGTMRYRRNRIRLQTLPEWSEDNPRIVEGLARLGEQLWRQQVYLEKEADCHLQESVIGRETGRILLDAERLSRYDSCLDPFVLRLLIRQIDLQLVPTQATVDRFSRLCRRNGSGRVEQGDLILERSKGQMMAMRRIADSVVPLPQVPVMAGAVTMFPNWRFTSQVVAGHEPGTHHDDREVSLDADCLHEPLVIRQGEAGDRYRPFGLHGTKKLYDLLADRSVPAFERGRIPVLSDQAGVLWPVGHPIAERARVTDATRRIFQVRATRV